MAQPGEGWLPAPDLRLTLEVMDQGRLVSLAAGSDQGERILAALQDSLSKASKLISDQLESGVIQWK
ncbi:hypothetical protein HORIV_25380 [Vreelandella olivaria]|uniref:Uncharacterized protein n=1 Tax=Vreelandella olivaria TaxID=390919 RepID=A0ABM7GHL7_9GAMM|nr:hypothetical protein HORIV_25380 [Halomonas olivaria]